MGIFKRERTEFDKYMNTVKKVRGMGEETALK
jgi:hypothetical protein